MYTCVQAWKSTSPEEHKPDRKTESVTRVLKEEQQIHIACDSSHYMTDLSSILGPDFSMAGEINEHVHDDVFDPCGDGGDNVSSSIPPSTPVSSSRSYLEAIPLSTLSESSARDILNSDISAAVVQCDTIIGDPHDADQTDDPSNDEMDSHVSHSLLSSLPLPTMTPVVQQKKHIVSRFEYRIVSGQIMLSPGVVHNVTAPARIRLFMSLFGMYKSDRILWTRNDIADKFTDLTGHASTCLVHKLPIGSGSSWHCKGAGVSVCDPCRVLKTKKQIGSKLRCVLCKLDGSELLVDRTGGIPRLILDLAELLDIDTRSEDYRDLTLMFRRLLDIDMTISSCTKLWTICCDGDVTYLSANKRFLGCLMAAGYRPKSDNYCHCLSKGLANLWHPTVIWTSGKYTTFTCQIRYYSEELDFNIADEYQRYQLDVIDDSVDHVMQHVVDWKTLANKCWNELIHVYQELKHGSRKRKRKPV